MGIMYHYTNKHRYRRAVIEQMLLKRHFPKSQTRILGMSLLCKIPLQTTENDFKYQVQLEYLAGFRPQVFVTNPRLTFVPGIHMYRNNSLCLFDPRTQPWDYRWHLHEKTIPWTAEWLIFYELFQLTGKWLGKSALHGPQEVSYGPSLEIADQIIIPPENHRPPLF